MFLIKARYFKFQCSKKHKLYLGEGRLNFINFRLRIVRLNQLNFENIKYMWNIIKQPINYQRLARSSVAIQILVCILLLIFVVKEGINFYRKNYVPYTFMYQTEKKYQEKSAVMIEHNNINKNQQQTEPKQIGVQNQNTNGYMKRSKDALRSQSTTNKQIQKRQVTVKSQVFDKQKQKIQNKQDNNNFGKFDLQFKINLRLERIMMKLPIFGIMVINIVLLSSFEFLVIISYICIILMFVNQFVSQRWQNLGIIMEICITAVTIGAFINGYVTQRVSPL